MKQLPSNYVLEKFYTYAGNPTFNKYNKVYNGSCPVCREGKSWLKKKRLYFYPESNSFYCFNCTQNWSAYAWIQENSGMTWEEVNAEAFSGNFSRDLTQEISKKRFVQREMSVLPYDSINLNDDQQKCFYGTNQYFQKALEYIEERKLNTAVNKNPAYYISLKDNFHKNRLCIPYYDFDKKIVFYQTRALDDSQPRYLGKSGADKTVFGIERAEPSIDSLFLFEGALDAIMVRNGVAVAGLTLTETQEKQLARFPFHDKIWVLDNPKMDETAKINIIKLLERKEKVFKWPDKPYKDFNDWAVSENLNEIDYKFILENLY
jgi:DNA primase